MALTRVERAPVTDTATPLVTEGVARKMPRL